MEREGKVITTEEMPNNELLPTAGVQEPQTVFLKTPLMIQVEGNVAENGETLADLLKRLYITEGKTFTAMGTTLGVSTDTISDWIRKLHPEIKIRSKSELLKKSWENPEHRANRISGYKTAWQEPKKRKARLPRIHSPKAEAERVKSYKKYFREHPEAAKAKVERVKRAKRERIIAAFGDNPQKAMRQMAIVDGLPINEIARLKGISPNTIRIWFKEEGVKPRRKRHGIDYKILAKRREMVKEAIQKGYFSHLTKDQQQILRALYLSRHGFPTQTSLEGKFHCTRANISLRDIDALKNLRNKRRSYLRSKS